MEPDSGGAFAPRVKPLPSNLEGPTPLHSRSTPLVDPRAGPSHLLTPAETAIRGESLRGPSTFPNPGGPRGGPPWSSSGRRQTPMDHIRLQILRPHTL